MLMIVSMQISKQNVWLMIVVAGNYDHMAIFSWQSL